jgi:hypothetical protein
MSSRKSTSPVRHQARPGLSQNPSFSQLHKPGVAQPKMATAPAAKQPPTAPPVYRPLLTPKVLQGKMTAAQHQPVNQARPATVAPPVYRPQPVPKVLQLKERGGWQQPSSESSRRPVAAKIRPAPPPHRPQPASAVTPQANLHRIPQKSAPSMQLKGATQSQIIQPTLLGAAIGATLGAVGLMINPVVGAVGIAAGALAGHLYSGSQLPTPLAVSTAPLPVLSASTVGIGAEGRCGYFERVKRWHVANPVPGVIVQHVTRTFEVQEVGKLGNMSGVALNNYVKTLGSTVNATETDYWELWDVDGAGNVSDGGTDTFGLCAIQPKGNLITNTTKGRFTMVGEARFYPTTTSPVALGFKRNAVTSAGGLYSTFHNPAANLPAPVGPSIKHRVIVNWDSSHDGRRYTGQYDQYGSVVATLT